jgi:hypothetical protein
MQFMQFMLLKQATHALRARRRPGCIYQAVCRRISAAGVLVSGETLL